MLTGGFESTIPQSLSGGFQLGLSTVLITWPLGTQTGPRHFSSLTLNSIYLTTIKHGYKLAMRLSCWVENKYETFSVRENHWNFFPG